MSFLSTIWPDEEERELLAIFQREEADFEHDLRLAAEDRALERADLIFDGAIRTAANRSASPDGIRLAHDPTERRLGWMPTR